MKNSMFKIMFPLFFYMFAIAEKMTRFFIFDPESLGAFSSNSKAGGGYTGIRFAPKSWLDVVPLPDVENPEYTSNDFRFKTGKSWIYIAVDDYKTDAPEEQGDNRFNNSFKSGCNFFVPGDNNLIRKAINEGIFNEEGYVLIDNCKDRETTLLGKGKCCAGSFKISYGSGKKASDEKGWTFVFSIEQEGVNTKYRGVGAMTEEFAVNPNDATPDVSKGSATYLFPENSAATEITALDNAIQGALMTFKWNSVTNHSTFTSGAVFQLAGAFTPVKGAILVLQATTTGTFAERYRKLPA